MARNEQEQEQFEREEALREGQTQYDPKVHGAGTVAPVAPESVVELHKMHVALEAKVKDLEMLVRSFLRSNRPSTNQAQQVQRAAPLGPAEGEDKSEEGSAGTESAFKNKTARG